MNPWHVLGLGLSLLGQSACTVTHAEIPTAYGVARLNIWRPIWSNYSIVYQHGDTTITVGTTLEHLDWQGVGILLGTAVKTALHVGGIP